MNRHSRIPPVLRDTLELTGNRMECVSRNCSKLFHGRTWNGKEESQGMLKTSVQSTGTWIARM